MDSPQERLATSPGQLLATMQTRLRELQAEQKQSNKTLQRLERELTEAILARRDETPILDTITREQGRAKGLEKTISVASIELENLRSQAAQASRETLYDQYEANVKEAFVELADLLRQMEDVGTRYLAIRGKTFRPDGYDRTRTFEMDVVEGAKDLLDPVDFHNFVAYLTGKPWYKLIKKGD